ncbi:MAG: hypothetical protein IJ594_05600 [Oscillospiraceae bacterium]|nr:hypothetical protein [Oscillospiraceae bacterium]
MKTFRRTLALLLALALTACLSATAFAAPGGPSAEDIVALGQEKKLVMPDEGSYLSDYKTMYISAKKYLSLSGYSEPREGMQLPRPVVFHGTRVTVLAEQDGYACILYRTADLAQAAAWVPERFLSEDYPGKELTVGKDGAGGTAADVTAEWSWGRFPGTGGRYLLLSEPVENCKGFTLDYQVIDVKREAPDKAEDKDVTGARTIYVYDGDRWVAVGSFAYGELETVHAVVTFEQPMTVVAVRTGADCKKPDAFVAREDVLDILKG